MVEIKVQSFFYNALHCNALYPNSELGMKKKWQKVTMLQYNIRMANLSDLVLVIPKWKGLLVNEGFC